MGPAPPSFVVRVRRPTTALHGCLEFYAVSTRLPEEFRLPPDDALRLLEDEILSRFRVHQLPHGAAVSFFRTAVEDRVMGGRIYDAHIASLALAARARTVVTENPRHFRSLEHHGIRVYTAEQYAAARGW